MTNSKNKGNTFERKIAKVLSTRFSEHTGIATAFTRNQNSGSYFGRTNQKRMATHDLDKAEFGDIVCPRDFIFALECKHYKTAPSFSSIVDSSYKKFDEWIEQAEQDAKNANKSMAIIMKFNNVKETVILKSVFGDLIPIVKYKEYFIVTLESFIEQDDKHFFA